MCTSEPVTTNYDINPIPSCENAGKVARDGRGVGVPGAVWERLCAPRQVTLGDNYTAKIKMKHTEKTVENVVSHKSSGFSEKKLAERSKIDQEIFILSRDKFLRCIVLVR